MICNSNGFTGVKAPVTRKRNGAGRTMQINKSAPFRILSLFEIRALVCVGSIAIAGPVLGAPVIQQVTGALDHKGTITITGTGFGTKTNAAPLVFDDAS